MKSIFLFLGLAVVLAACASSSEGDLPDARGGLTKCVPNQTLVCLCGLDEGMQKCTEDGELTPCECGGKKDDGDAKPSQPNEPPAPAPEKCGNGQVDPGEACDDGNRRDDDGCSSDCKPDGAPTSGAMCPGQRVLVWKGTPVLLSGTTDRYSNNAVASCFGSTGPDRVYAIQPSADGFLRVDGTFAAGFNAVVDVRVDDCSSGASVLCQDTMSAPFQRVIAVEKSRIYYLFVDGDAPTSRGVYTIRLELP